MHVVHCTNQDRLPQDLRKMNLEPSITPRFTHNQNLLTILNQQFRFDKSATVESKLGLKFELVRDILC